MIEKKYIIVKHYQLKELAAIYGVDKRTLKKWMKPFDNEIGIRTGYYFLVNQVRVIFEKIPLPDNVIIFDHFEDNDLLKKARS
jgi:hypothetical protein